MKVLVAESSRLFHIAWERLIRDLGQEPVFATTGEEAIRWAQGSSCYTGLISHTLPDMDGETCLVRIQQLAPIPLYRPVVVTSNPDAWRASLMNEPIWEVVDRQNLPAIRRILEDRIRDCAIHPPLPVLYLDDSQVAAKHMQDLFSKIGVSLHHFSTPNEALRALGEIAYELILCDVQIEDAVTGYDLVPQIRQAVKTGGRPPVILVSANDSLDQRQLALLSGADDFWSKSISIGIVQKHLERSRESRLLRERIVQLERKVLAERFLESESGLPNDHALKDYASWRFRVGFAESSLIRVVLIQFHGQNGTTGETPEDLPRPTIPWPELCKWKSSLPQTVFCAHFPPTQLVLVMPALSVDPSAEESPWQGLPPLPHAISLVATPDITSLVVRVGAQLDEVWRNLRPEHETAD